MSYNRFTQPRAYVDLITFDLATGWRSLSNISMLQDDGSTAVTFQEGSKSDIFDARPQNVTRIEKENQSFYIQYNTGNATDALAESNFLAIMNHNFASADAVFVVQTDDSSTFSSPTTVSTTGSHTKVVNATANDSAGEIDPAEDGWTLITWPTQESNNQYLRITISDENGTGQNFLKDPRIGSIMFGEYFDFPSMDLSLSTDIEYDGTTLINSTGGSTFANSSYLAQPTWSATNPWTNTDASNQQTYGFIRRNGRLRHSMNFSYLADTNIFTESMHHHDEGSGLSLFYDAETMHSNFYNRIFGQHLPFLFSIDKDSTSEGDYGMFRLANNSLKTTQVASRTWNVGLDLVESW